MTMLPVTTETRREEGAAAAAPERALLGGLATTVILALTMFVEAVGYGLVAPTLPFLARSTGAGEGAIGFLVGVYAAVGLVASIPLGILANRHGRRTLILVGLACLMLASVGFVIAPTYGWLLAARLAQGLGGVAIWVGGLTVAADLSSSESMGKSLSIMTASWSLGFIVGPALGGLGGLKFPFLLYALLSAVALVAGAMALPETGRPRRTTLRGILRVLRYGPVLASAAATVAMSCFYGAIEAFVPLMADARGVSRPGIGVLFAIAGVPSALLPRVTGALADRFGDLRMIVGGLLFTAVLSGGFLAAFRSLPLWVVFTLIGFVEVLIYVPAIALLHRGMSNEERIFASGSHSYAFSGGFFLGPFLGGALVVAGGYGVLFAALAGVMLASIAVVGGAMKLAAAPPAD
jgi:predicted MFS family arabinose efflux permease